MLLSKSLFLALLLLWGPYGTLGRYLSPEGVELMFTPYAIILANIVSSLSVGTLVGAKLLWRDRA